MGNPTRFMVSWDDHSTHLVARLGHLLERQQLVDVTLMCNTHSLKVHRSVLAACSPYFEVITCGKTLRASNVMRTIFFYYHQSHVFGVLLIYNFLII